MRGAVETIEEESARGQVAGGARIENEEKKNPPLQLEEVARLKGVTEECVNEIQDYLKNI